MSDGAGYEKTAVRRRGLSVPTFDSLPVAGASGREASLSQATTVAAIVERDGERTFRRDELDPCGECLKGKCDGCDMCDYFAEQEASGWR